MCFIEQSECHADENVRDSRARAYTQVLSRQETNVILAILGKVGKHFEMINDNLTVDKPDND